MQICVFEVAKNIHQNWTDSVFRPLFPGLFVVSIFAVLCLKVSAANNEGHLYYFVFVLLTILLLIFFRVIRHRA